MSRNIPIINSTTGELERQNTVVGHLYEIELNRFELLEDASASTDTIIIDNLDRCSVGIDLYIGTTINDEYRILHFTVTEINYKTQSIKLNTTLGYDFSAGAIFTEGINSNHQNIKYDTNTGIDYLSLEDCSFGILTGYIHITDFDVSILAPAERVVYNNNQCGTTTDNNIVYTPFPVTYNGTSSENTGKKGSVSVTLANIDRVIGGVVLNHKSFSGHRIKIYTVYLDDLKPRSVENYFNFTYIGKGDVALNEPFFDYIPIYASRMVLEFEGLIYSTTITDKAVNFTAYSLVDDNNSTIIPRRTYTSLRCQFVFKGEQCKFRSDVLLNEDIDATQIGWVQVSSAHRLYFGATPNTTDAETLVVKIGDEYIEIEDCKRLDETTKLPKPAQTRIAGYIIDSSLPIQYKLKIKTRGYSNTTASSHSTGDTIDIPFCRKTLHHCELIANDLNYGAFPGVPKYKGYM